jgi:2-methylaconitate cis-trans-isomerase PrpF
MRFISDTQPHRAIPLTAALCTAVAAKIEGTIVQQCLAPELVNSETFNQHEITIGHTSGKIQVNATIDAKGDAECATVYRTARRIFEGQMFWNE